MGENLFMVLDYSTGRIIRGLEISAVLVTARVLMQLPNPSFDIVDVAYKKFVTQDFQQKENGVWVYNPMPICEAAQ